MTRDGLSISGLEVKQTKLIRSLGRMNILFFTVEDCLGGNDPRDPLLPSLVSRLSMKEFVGKLVCQTAMRFSFEINEFLCVHFTGSRQ